MASKHPTAAVDLLNEQQRETLKKCGTERLRIILAKADYAEEEVLKLDRPGLMEAVAELWLKPKPELKSEDEKWREEMELRKAQLQWERERWEKEREERERKDKIEKERWEVEQQERVNELKLKEQKQRQWEERYRKEDQQRKSLAARLKTAGDSLKHILPQMPSDIIDMPLFFSSIEKLYANFDIDKDLRAKLLMPQLTMRARSILGRMPSDDLDNYDKVKRFLLAEFKLTPRQIKSQFVSAVKQRDETYQLFSSRLTTLLRYYIESRAAKDDYDKLCQLLVADRLKDALPSDALQYVLSLEGEEWFEPNKIANLADIFVNNCRDRGRASVEVSKSVEMERRPPVGELVNRNTTLGRKCWNCGSDKHLSRSCDKPKKNVNPPFNASNRAPNRVQTKACAVVNEQSVRDDVTAVDKMPGPVKLTDSLKASSVDCAFVSPNSSVIDLMCSATCVEPCLKISPLKYVDVIVNGECLRALNDSGTQIPVISRSAIKEFDPVGQIQIQGVVGAPVSTPLVALDMKLARADSDQVDGFLKVEQTLNVVFAVADDLAMQCDVILPPSVIDELSSLISVELIAEARHVGPENELVVDDGASTDDSVDCDSLVMVGVSATAATSGGSNATDGDNNDETERLTSVKKFADEQRIDTSLTEAFKWAADETNGYFLQDQVLYHKDSMAGQVVSQLVVPAGRRDEIFAIAHNSIFSGHLRERKTKQRIKMSFYWPGMAGQIKRWCAECVECQLRARSRTDDRVPITPIARAPLPFHTLNMDVVGPIQDKAPYPWILTIVDSCTRWPSAFLLKSLTAKAVCECLLMMFANVGVASVIISDRGTNFTSQLTDEFLKRLGCSPRLLSPNHPQASGLVERYNATFKGMLAHVVRENPGTWHKLVPLIVWSTREVPNATTGVSPYQMVYGRIPRGVLAILKESWAGDCPISPSLAKSTVSYLQELKEKLEIAAEYAKENCASEQKRYTNYYNLRAKDKTFAAGEKVIVLCRDSTNKVYSRWRLGVVQKVLSPHSYLVDMEDGSSRHLHANHMRKFVAHVHSVVMVHDSDKDFGRVSYPPSRMVSNLLLPSQRVKIEQIEHLSVEQRVELLSILDEFADVFSDKPGLCTLVEHKIQTTSEFKPKAFKAYRIPEVLRQEVDRQIDQLIEWNFIEPAQGPMASPIVCALKKDRSIRLAVNYVYLNKYTVPDAFPMPNAEEVMWRISQANFISCFDARMGYYQLPMCDEDSWLTGFVTHRGLYRWKRCPFGLRNSSASFVRMIALILKPIADFSEAYVDDMGVHSKRWSQHMHDLVAYFTVIRRANLTLNLKKSSFGRPEIAMVGHIIGSGNHRPDPSKLSVLQNLERPTTKSELRRLLGMFGYYRNYIVGFADIAKPLTDLTGNEIPVDIPWGDEQEFAFQRLRQAMCSAPVLTSPRFGEPFFIQTDASGTCVGCCLGQWDESNEEHPIAYASQKLSAPQCNWAVVEKEAYAVVWGLQKYRSIIFGSAITVMWIITPSLICMKWPPPVQN